MSLFSSRVPRPTSHVLFAILWRLTILLLPWQSRWIFEEGIISGFKWESGTVSLYITWILIAATAACSALLYWNEWKRVISKWSSGTVPVHGLFGWIRHLKESFSRPSFTQRIIHAMSSPFTRGVVISLVVMALFLPTVFSSAPDASLIWWGNVTILVVLFASLRIAKIGVSELLFWFVLSLLPQAAMGLFQYFNQDAFGSAMLGMAAHHPWLAGTSVVEHGLYRVLRAYGGMPHPNIFGGWLAMGLTALPFLISSRKSSFGRIFISLTGFLFACALIFSYSRSAWIAAIVGFITSIYWLWRRLDETDRLRLVSFFVVILASIGLCVMSNFDHVNARFHPEVNRLEAWSLAMRSRASEDGMLAFQRRQVTGWGQGGSLVASVVTRTKDLKRFPILLRIDPEPAHNVPQVILVEMGLIGFLGVLFLALLGYRWYSRLCRVPLIKKEFHIRIPHPFVFVLLVLAAFDHYTWTLWAGQTLVAMALLMAVQACEDREKETLTDAVKGA